MQELCYSAYMLVLTSVSEPGDIWNANGVYLSAVLENTALVQGIRCEPLGENLFPWTCAVFSHSARKWILFVFSHTTIQNFQRRKVVYRQPTWQTKVVNRRRSVNNTCSLAIQYVGLYNLYTCSTTECGIGWYRDTSDSKNTTSKCENTYVPLELAASVSSFFVWPPVRPKCTFRIWLVLITHL